MEYSFEQWVNRLVHAHPLMGSVVIEFSHWGVALFGVLAVGLWLLSPPGDTRWKRAGAAGLSAAALGLLANQVISHVWDRARPYEAHHAIVPLLPRSADPSFPSDHATAALSIAFGVFFVSRRAGWFFLVFAAVVSASRVLAGMHYPSDVLASLVVAVACGFLAARLAMRPILVPLIRLASRLTDPVLARIAGLAPVRRTVLDARVRSIVVAVVCVAIFVRIVSAERAHLLDEMELSVLAGWVCVAAFAVWLSLMRFWPPAAHD
ncbi:MAG TPA: phosphatase PAP2 family protein [Gaiellales bacterium]